MTKQYCANYTNGYGQLGVEAARKAYGWATEPFPSKQPVQLPGDYVANGERLRGMVAGAGVTAIIALAIYSYFCKK